MNVKVIALFVLFLAFGSIAKAQEITGGIVYSDGEDAIYYDFAKKETRNLTSDLEKAVVRYPFAVSENGKFLVWLQNSRFFVRELPIAEPYAVKFSDFTKRGRRGKSVKDPPIKDIIWQGNEIKNLSLSPDGARFAFDTIFQTPGWVNTGKRVYGEENNGPGTGKYFPFYKVIMDNFNGIFYLSTIYNRADHLQDDAVTKAPVIGSFLPRYGNVVESPPVPFKASWEDMYPGRPYDPSVSEWTGSGVKPEMTRMISDRRRIKKNAGYLAFQKLENWERGEKLAAFIYQIDNQWGPIELRVLDSKKHGEIGDSDAGFKMLGPISEIPEEYLQRFQKPRSWEILLSLKSCGGLSLKPDGSIIFLSEGNLYSIDFFKIQGGINKSGVATSVDEEGFVGFNTVNNVFTVEPELIAEKIDGASISWVSNEAFLFLGRDMVVYLWNQGKKENVSYSPISSQFYYCSKSPLDNVISNPNPTSQNPFIPKASNEADVPPFASGKDKVPADRDSEYHDVPPFSIGSIKIFWTYGPTDDGKTVNIFIEEGAGGKRGLKLALPEENDLNNIKDPSLYTYKSNWRSPKREYTINKSGNLVNKIVTMKGGAPVPLGTVIIFESGDDYAAIKPVELKLRDRHPKDEAAKEEWIICEWKFWSQIQKFKKSRKNKDQNKTALNK